jgi:probable blue pigment (indigoidine) exporter
MRRPSVVPARSRAMSRPPFARRDLLALILAAACWGVGTVVSKAALDSIPPLTLLPIQLAASLAILVVLLRRRGIPLRGGAPARLGRLGLLNPGVAYALGLIGLTTISASLSVLLWALEPLLILALAVAVLHERVTPSVVVLSLVAVVGMVLVVYEPAAGGQLIGVALTVAGVACCAVYTIITRRFIPEARETGPVLLAQQAHALVLALGIVLLVGLAGGAIAPSALTPLGLASAIGSGALYYAAAYWFYLGALRHVPASLAAVSFYLIPVVGVAAGALFLGERLGPAQWVGAAIVLAATATILRRSIGASVEAAPVSAPA